jgi:hypothetical protein
METTLKEKIIFAIQVIARLAIAVATVAAILTILWLGYFLGMTM